MKALLEFPDVWKVLRGLYGNDPTREKICDIALGKYIAPTLMDNLDAGHRWCYAILRDGDPTDAQREMLVRWMADAQALRTTSAKPEEPT